MIVGFTGGNGNDAIDGPSELVAEYPLDELPAAERGELLAQIDRGLEALRRGEPGVPAEDVLRGLEPRRARR